ncbi:MAG: lytic murein transglycosylase [Minisyncoccia bacterium]
MSNFNIKYLPRKKVEDIRLRIKNNKNEQKINENNFLRFFSIFNKNIPSKTLTAIILIIIVFSTNFSWVNSPVFLIPNEVEAQNDAERLRLEKELEEVEKQIAEYEKQLQTTKQAKQTLQNKINELKQRANKLNLQIEQTNLNLNYLNVQINEVLVSIAKTSSQMANAQQNLANLLQSLYQLKEKSLIEILLESNKISDFFNYINALNSLQLKIQDNIKELEDLRTTLTNQNQKLSQNREEMEKLLAMQLLQKDSLTNTQKQQQQLLKITQGNEAKYQQLLSESQKKANEIRGRLYDLLGVKTQVTFGEALDIANWVSARTGIRPAFLLAILTQESNLGKNVGTCNRPGDPYEKSWQAVMKPDSRDAFLQITKELGLDPNVTPISCPIHNPKRGMIAGKNSWGGAMGPAQFMPKTWLVYKDEIARITGHNPPNPWDVRDAFVAAALYLTNWGADKKTREAEWRAAMIYFSGSTNRAYSFYGDNVMAIADRYEADIKTLEQIAYR